MVFTMEFPVKKILIACLAITIFPALVSAHPGKQDSQGCHVCRKNCDAWSVPWNVKHCHGDREDAPVPFKLMSPAKGGGQFPADLKSPGWEYGMHIKNIRADRPHYSDAEK